MDFKDKLNEYIELLDCTAKELAGSSGLSAATISRYRSGERTPKADSDNLSNLITGIVMIAQEKNITSITTASVTDTLFPLALKSSIDPEGLRINFNNLLNVLSINISELAKFLNYDSSYISRIKNGQRQPSRPLEFASSAAYFVARRYQRASDKTIVAGLIGCNPAQLDTQENYIELLTQWLTRGAENPPDYLNGFLEKLDAFNLNEYIRIIHFDELKVPTVPFRFPTSKSYFGLKEMMDSELAFLKATVLSKSMEPVTMYSDMPMEEMAKDPDFPRKWMFGMAVMLKKGLHLNQIHNIDRSLEDMMLGLESWIPMYMTGQVSPYYLRGVQNNVFSHFLKVSGTVALTGEAISGYHSDGKYYLTNNKEEVAYYKKRASHLLANAAPLIEIYRADSERAYNAFLQSDSKTAGERYTILSSLPLYTLTDSLLTRILAHNDVPAEEQEQIRHYMNLQRELAAEILQHDKITDIIPALTEKDFHEYPLSLSLSGMFLEKDIFYTWEHYLEHLESMQNYETQHANYSCLHNPSPMFQNIQILTHDGKWVMVSKNKTPAIHFLIRHPKMRVAFETMVGAAMEKGAVG